MLDELQKAKLVEWAEWRMEHIGADMPAGIAEVDEWDFFFSVGLAGQFPTFDTETPYTFGEDHG